MHDYQLERLNTRSFEQLIQALVIQSLGHTCSVFGDGPDGGREAIFEGRVACPTVERPWHGSGVVQAKFRQQLDSSPAKNATWVLQQLRKEFTKLVPRGRRRRKADVVERGCPDYYILATNVTLSPVSKQGGKDRVRAQMDAYKKSHGLKDYAIWDGDQIRRMIDAHPGIRTTYLGWLLPGDVLAEMLKVMGGAKPDFVKTLRRFIQSELLADQLARLSQGGYKDANDIALSSLFLDLPLEKAGASETVDDEDGAPNTDADDAGTEANEDTFLSLLCSEGREVLRPSAQQSARPEKNTGRTQSGRITLIGGPGQGKTTLGVFACQLYRAALLQGSEERLSAEVTQALMRIQGLSEELPAVGVRRYPLRVDLKYFAAAMASPNQSSVSLLDYLTKQIGARTNTTLSAEDLRQWLGAYPWLLVLDGLDEVPASSNRPQVMQAIREFICVDAQEADADLLVLATTRPQGYSEEFSPTVYRHVALSPLDEHYALKYGLRLATARHPGQIARIEELTKSLGRATNNPATARLMQSPLQVTIMLALIEGGGEPPEQRWKLFHEYYNVIYRREQERDTPFAAILRKYEPDIHWIHHRVGWILQQRNAAAGSTNARLTHEEFEQLVDARLLDRGHNDPAKRQELVRHIRRAATDRLVFLVGNTDSEIGFEIRSLQEFMAAEHFFDGGESCVQQALHAVAPLPYWRNVFLFVAGRIFFERQELIDNVLAVCGAMNESPHDPAQAAVLTGSRLAVALLRDGVARNQPAALRVIARCAARIFDACEREGEGEGESSLVDLFMGEAEEVLRDELTKRLALTGGRFPRHNWTLCVHLAASDKAWAEGALIMHFPWARFEAVKLIADLDARGIALPNPIRTIFAERVLEHPLSVLSPRRSERAEAHPETGSRAPLQALYATLTYRGRDSWPLRIHGTQTRMALRFGGAAARAVWASVDYPAALPASAHSDWIVVQAVSAFSREPTASGLLRQLHILAERCPTVDDNLPGTLFPWQMSLCISSRVEGTTWDTIIERVAAGALGTEADWKRWEALCESGLDLERCRTQEAWGVSDRCLGLITRACGYSITYRIDEGMLLPQELATSLGNYKDQRTLIRLCCSVLSHWAPTEGMRPPGLIRDFLEACVAQRVRMRTALLFAVLVDSASETRTCVTMLASAASCDIEPFHTFHVWNSEHSFEKLNQKLAAVIDAAVASDRWREVLLSLSWMPPVKAWARIAPSHLHELSLGEVKYRGAARRLTLGRLDWAADDAERYARLALEAEAEVPTFLSVLLNHIDSSGAAGVPLENFLVSLLRQGDTLEFDQVARVSALLIKLLQRRAESSVVPDPAAKRAVFALAAVAP